MTSIGQPRPIKILEYELDEKAPGLEIAGYDTAWVVLRSAGKPLGVVEIDLTQPLTARQSALNSMVATHKATLVPASRSSFPDTDLPSISVVVPSIVSRTDSLRRCLARLNDLDYPNYEIILVDNRPTRPAGDIVAGLIGGLQRVRVIREEWPGISAARNAGVAAARGQLVAFTDDDVEADRGWLRGIGTRFTEDPGLDAVTGLVLPAQLETSAQVWYERYYGGFSGERTFRPFVMATQRGRGNRAVVEARDSAGCVVDRFAIYGIGRYGAGANMAFQTETVRARPFNLALGTGTPARGGEDLDMLLSLLWQGGRIAYEPCAVVLHEHRRDYEGLLGQMVGNGLGYTAMLCAQVHRDPRHIFGLASQLPVHAWRLSAQNLARLRGHNRAKSDVPFQFPPALAQKELRGMLQGPTAYLESLRHSRVVRRNLMRDPA